MGCGERRAPDDAEQWCEDFSDGVQPRWPTNPHRRWEEMADLGRADREARARLIRSAQRAEVRHAKVNSRRSVFCSGSLDLRAQAEHRSVLRPDTPKQVRQRCPDFVLSTITRWQPLLMETHLDAAAARLANLVPRPIRSLQGCTESAGRLSLFPPAAVLVCRIVLSWSSQSLAR
jgi:hypothetical protein